MLPQADARAVERTMRGSYRKRPAATNAAKASAFVVATLIVVG
jgi:hypothetical protein